MGNKAVKPEDAKASRRAATGGMFSHSNINYLLYIYILSCNTCSSKRNGPSIKYIISVGNSARAPSPS